MDTLSSEIRDVIDTYKRANSIERLMISGDTVRQLFIAERIWKQINKIDVEYERLEKGDVE